MSDMNKQSLSTFSYKNLVNDSKISVESDDNWLITMSDVFSLLLVFFIMFYVMTKNGEKDKGTQEQKALNVEVQNIVIKPEPVSSVEKIKTEMQSMISNLNIEDDVFVQAMNKEIIITMKEKVTFKPAEAVILKNSEPILDNIATIVKNYPSCMVEIDGHTDNVPIHTQLYPSNWELSVARATSVLKYFIDTHGIDPSRFYIKGNADLRPVAPNDTLEQKAQNRRVEIRLKEVES